MQIEKNISLMGAAEARSRGLTPNQFRHDRHLLPEKPLQLAWRNAAEQYPSIEFERPIESRWLSETFARLADDMDIVLHLKASGSTRRDVGSLLIGARSLSDNANAKRRARDILRGNLPLPLMQEGRWRLGLNAGGEYGVRAYLLLDDELKARAEYRKWQQKEMALSAAC